MCMCVKVKANLSISEKKTEKNRNGCERGRCGEKLSFFSIDDEDRRIQEKEKEKDEKRRAIQSLSQFENAKKNKKKFKGNSPNQNRTQKSHSTSFGPFSVVRLDPQSRSEPSNAVWSHPDVCLGLLSV